MTSKQLAAACSVSQRTIYNLKARFPEQVPASFGDVDGWKRIVEANRTVVAGKRNAPRRDPELASDHSRYVAARADRTESLAASERIRLEITRRNTISRAEVEVEFGRIASIIRARLLKMLNDLPSALLGLDEAAIHKVASEKLAYAMRDLKLLDTFLAPKDGQKLNANSLKPGTPDTAGPNRCRLNC